MGIINKQNLKEAMVNPFLFVIIILLIIWALSQSFALWCFIGGIIGIFVTLLGKDPNQVINSFCGEDSWKVKSIQSLSNFLGTYTIWIIIASLVVWVLLNFTKKGKELISLLDG